MRRLTPAGRGQPAYKKLNVVGGFAAAAAGPERGRDGVAVADVPAQEADGAAGFVVGLGEEGEGLLA